MAGGEPRLGTTATYMRRHDHRAARLSTEIDKLHARLYNEYQVFSASSVRKWSKFGLTSSARTEKVRLAEDPYAEGAPGRLGARWPGGRDYEPRQAILSGSRAHQASPGEVLCGGRGGRTARHRGAADCAQTLCRWRRV